MCACSAADHEDATTIYVVVTAGDVLGGRDEAPRREEHLKAADLHHEFSIRCVPTLAPAAAAKRVRRFAHQGSTSTNDASITVNDDFGLARVGGNSDTGKAAESPSRQSKEDSLIVGPEFEFVRCWASGDCPPQQVWECQTLALTLLSWCVVTAARYQRRSNAIGSGDTQPARYHAQASQAEAGWRTAAWQT